MLYIIKIEPEAEHDIQEGIAWYNEQQSGLGREFYAAVKAHLKSLQINPFYQLRYDEVHCLPLKKWPYMIYFTINEETEQVIIHALLNTARNPNIWKKRS